MSDKATATGHPPEAGPTSESAGLSAPTISDAPTGEPKAPIRITVDLDEQPILEIVKNGKVVEFPADTFLLAVHESGILKKELRDEWSKNLTATIEKVTGFTVGPLKAAEIYAGVLRLSRAYQKKAESRLSLDTTSPDSEPPKSEE